MCAGRERVGGFGCYDVIRNSSGVTWYEAYKYCDDLGKSMLAIESAEENDAIKDYFLFNQRK